MKEARFASEALSAFKDELGADLFSFFRVEPLVAQLSTSQVTNLASNLNLLTRNLLQNQTQNQTQTQQHDKKKKKHYAAATTPIATKTTIPEQPKAGKAALASDQLKNK